MLFLLKNWGFNIKPVGCFENLLERVERRESRRNASDLQRVQLAPGAQERLKHLANKLEGTRSKLKKTTTPISEDIATAGHEAISDGLFLRGVPCRGRPSPCPA